MVIEQFVCDNCKTIYELYLDAESCEKKHEEEPPEY